jgi:hypothetical protein
MLSFLHSLLIKYFKIKGFYGSSWCSYLGDSTLQIFSLGDDVWAWKHIWEKVESNFAHNFVEVMQH